MKDICMSLSDAFILICEYVDPFDLIVFLNSNKSIKNDFLSLSNDKKFKLKLYYDYLIMKSKRNHMKKFCNKYNIKYQIVFSHHYNGLCASYNEFNEIELIKVMEISYKNIIGNELHRTNGPAIVKNDGSQYWYWYGELHRTNGPAVIKHNCEKWYLHGKLHRTNGPAVIDNDGDQYWYLHGKLHRTNGPAVIQKNIKKWFFNGKFQAMSINGIITQC